MEKNRQDPFLDEDDINELLMETVDMVDDQPRDSITGYPTRPLYRDIGTILNSWLQTRFAVSY